MLKKIIASSLLVLGTTIVSPHISSAQYITAVENVHYEKYIVDTSSIYYPTAQHQDRFNVGVYYYGDIKNPDKAQPYVYKFKFENNTWYIHAADDSWNEVEPNSISSDVLRVCLPYLQ